MSQPTGKDTGGAGGPAMTKGMQLFYEQLQALDWLKPWALMPLRTGALYVEELTKELPSGHVLSGRSFAAVAKRGDCDDVLFLVDVPGPYVAVVHLTWAGQRESRPEFPATTLCPSVAEFAAKVMAADHAEREAGEFPGIVCTPGTLGGSPRFEGHRIDIFHAMSMLLEEPSPEDYFAAFGIEDLTVEDLKAAARYCRSRQCEKDRPESYCCWCSMSRKNDGGHPDDEDPKNFRDGWLLAERVMKKYGWG